MTPDIKALAAKAGLKYQTVYHRWRINPDATVEELTAQPHGTNTAKYDGRTTLEWVRHLTEQYGWSPSRDNVRAMFQYHRRSNRTEAWIAERLERTTRENL